MSFEITQDHCEFLVELARKSITTFLETGIKTTPPLDMPAKLKQKCGVFVTLNKIRDKRKELRGCVGFPLPDLPLIDATIEAAISAAVRDPRFPQVKIQELRNITMEISVLTPPTLIEVKDPKDYLKEVKIGVDGLIIEREWSKGLLLPQVALEWGWNVEEFITNCCLKAGLPPDSWLIKGTKLYKFTCIIAHEVFPCGPIKVVDMRKYEE